ncbi:MAG: SIMPL domain-containing protein [Burkholderiales bacterium]|nr:SIMPL domain-containing protein [Burkholderiales bacterium]
MDRYIEVIGNSTLVEAICKYKADVTLNVRAVQIETAIKESVELRAQCIRQLKAAGMADDQLQEGGAESWRPWFWKKKVGQEASQKILVTCDDMQHLMLALGSLEPLFENQRYSLNVDMRPPQFETNDEIRLEAERRAFLNAKSKADVLANAAGLRLNGVLEMEELAATATRTGTFGDEDWRSYGVCSAPVSGGVSDSSEKLEAATRSARIRYRVRFATLPLD